MPIFDQGYQHWKGPVSGYGWRWLAVTRHGVRSVLQNKLVRLLLLAAWLPALALVGALVMWGLLEQRAETILKLFQGILPKQLIDDPHAFRVPVWTVLYYYFFKFELYTAMFLVLAVGPNLISRDLRFNALPLYFSRPLRRFDYFVGKLGVIGFFLLATVVAPAVGAYVLGLAFSLDLTVIRDTYRLLIAAIVYGLVITLSAGTLVLALSSLSRRTVYVGLAWAGFFFLSLAVSGILIGIRLESERDRIIDETLNAWVAENPPPPGITIRRHSVQMRNHRITPMETPEDRAREQWQQAYYSQFGTAIQRASTGRTADNRADWRPLCAYSTNLDRVGEWLLDVDSAWVTFGAMARRPQQMLATAQHVGAVPKNINPIPTPADDRFLADSLTWQFPVSWSIAVLVGLWLLSVLVLTTRVKTLDRLK